MLLPSHRRTRQRHIWSLSLRQASRPCRLLSHRVPYLRTCRPAEGRPGQGYLSSAIEAIAVPVPLQLSRSRSQQYCLATMRRSPMKANRLENSKKCGLYSRQYKRAVATTAHPSLVVQVAAALGRGRGVCSHAVEGGGLVGIGFCSTGAVRFATLHFSPTFDKRPFVGTGLECSVLRGAGEFVFVDVLIAVLHAFDKFTVAGYVIALQVEKLGADTGFHLVSRDVAFNSRTVDLFDRIGVTRLVADGNAVLI